MWILAIAASVAAAPVEAPVGYDELVEGRNIAAIETIRSDDSLEADDPAKLINLGVAFARQGRTEEARAMFDAAMRSNDRVVLETADGEWKDSRHLARQALKRLDRNGFATEQMAAR